MRMGREQQTLICALLGVVDILLTNVLNSFNPVLPECAAQGALAEAAAVAQQSCSPVEQHP